MCGKEVEDIEHVLNICEHTGKRDEGWKAQMRADKRVIARLKKIVWDRKEKERNLV